MISLAVLAVVFLLIAVRQVGSVRLGIWQIMVGGAVVVILAGQISPADAWQAIHLDVILFLFFVFVLGQAMEQSGLLENWTTRALSRVKSVSGLLCALLFGMGGASALLMNDTVAVVGTPLMLMVASQQGLGSEFLLLSLAFAVTLGSVVSPIGNPQNLLIALRGLPNPFVTFPAVLLLPTLVNLLLTFAVLRLFYRSEFVQPLRNLPLRPVVDDRLASLCKLSLGIMAALIACNIAMYVLSPDRALALPWIAFAAALPVLAGARERFRIVRAVDWGTLWFFAAMFVLMDSVWRTGLLQKEISRYDVSGTGMILGLSVTLSQVVSNVPLVALYLPLVRAVPSTMLALAAGSTIAGNLFILGAASNVIIIQNAEKRGQTVTFWRFARVGIPVTILNLVVYWLFLKR